MKSKIIILILVIFIYSACRLNSIQSENTYINVSNINNTKTFSGYIKARDIKKLYFQTEGKISFLPYSKGDFVKKGQVLARLDSIPYKIKKEKLNFEDEVNYNIMTSPFDGFIEEIYTPVNSYVKNKEIVLSMYPTNKTEAETLIKPEYINKINLKKGGKIKYKNSQYEAKIANITKNDDNYIITLELNSLYKELKEGTHIGIELDLNP